MSEEILSASERIGVGVDEKMIVTGWNNGSPDTETGSGYGLRLSWQDRDSYFQREWPSVTIELGKEATAEVRLAPSFWRHCTELRGAAIGKWLLDHGFAPWPKGRPPKLRLELVGSRRFRLNRD